MPPQTNATLYRVQQPGAGEAVDGPPAPGPEVWAGAVSIYVRERRARRRDGQAGDVHTERTLIVDNASPPVDWRIGQLVTYAYPPAGPLEVGEIAHVSRASIEDRGVPADLQTARLQLTPG